MFFCIHDHLFNDEDVCSSLFSLLLFIDCFTDLFWFCGRQVKPFITNEGQDKKGNVGRCFEAKDRVSVCRNLFIKKHGNEKEINLETSGGYIDGQDNESNTGSKYNEGGKGGGNNGDSIEEGKGGGSNNKLVTGGSANKDLYRETLRHCVCQRVRHYLLTILYLP